MSTEARVADYEREDMLYKEQARLVAALAEARAQIDFLNGAITSMRAVIAERDSTIARERAQIAASEQEHQDFRLQNDSEWRAKLDHLKAQIAAKDAALQAIVNECGRFPIKDGLAFRCESIALNALAAKLMARTAPAQIVETQFGDTGP